MESSPQPLTVTQLTAAIRQQLEGVFPLVRLQGEVSNAKMHSSGHFYFSLKDSNAQIAAVMFRQETLRLSRIPRDGDSVVVSANLQVYPPMGRYQLNVKELHYAGVGELLMKLHALKSKLEQMGWFDAKHKKPLPSHPKVIGVVTSPTGAVIQDILNVLTRRFSGFRLILNPVRVQGEGAAAEIAKAIHDFNRYRLADVLIVGRGGGSFEDLWPFNEEIVVEAIFRSQIPIISAVGHETDTCLADFVADVRAPTPSAAAEIVTAELRQHLEWLSQMQRRLLQTLKLLIRHDQMRLEGLKRHPTIQSPRTLLNLWSQRFDETVTQIDEAAQNFLSRKKLGLDHAAKRLEALRPATQLSHARARLIQLQQQLDATANGRIEQSRALLFHQKQRLHSEWRRRIDFLKGRFYPEMLQQKLNNSWRHRYRHWSVQLSQCHEMLSALNPRHLLSRGYTILFSEKENCAITSVSELAQGCRVRMLLADGEATSVVENVSVQIASKADVVM